MLQAIDSKLYSGINIAPKSERLSNERATPIDCIFLTPWMRTAEEVARLLKNTEIHIHHAATLKQAKSMLLQTGARVLLSEVVFADGNWEDATKMIGEFELAVSVVVVTGRVDERFWITVLERGAYDLIPRPFSSSELLRIVENAHAHAEGVSGAESKQPNEPEARPVRRHAAQHGII
jgi:DNA-binding NtrC family response regulator